MPTVVSERALIEEVGRFDEQQLFGEFHDLCLRLAMKSQVLTLREALCSVRIHGEHYSADKIADRIGWIRLYEKMSALTPSAKLRSHCAKMCGQTYLNLARLHLDEGDHKKGWKALRKGLAYSFGHPQLWWRAFKRTIDLAIPRAIRRDRQRKD